MSRLYAYLIAVVAVLALVLGYGHVRFQAGEKAAEARMQADVDIANARADKAEAEGKSNAEKIDREGRALYADLETRYNAAVAKLAHGVRCTSTRNRPVPKTAADPTLDPGSPHGPGHAAEDAGPDIAPGLIAYAKLAEQYRIALNSCRAYGAKIDRFRATIPDGPHP